MAFPCIDNGALFLFDSGSFALKKEMLDERRFPKMHLNLQRLLQVVSPPHSLVSMARSRKDLKQL